MGVSFTKIILLNLNDTSVFFTILEGLRVHLYLNMQGESAKIPEYKSSCAALGL